MSYPSLMFICPLPRLFSPLSNFYHIPPCFFIYLHFAFPKLVLVLRLLLLRASPDVAQHSVVCTACLAFLVLACIYFPSFFAVSSCFQSLVFASFRSSPILRGFLFEAISWRRPREATFSDQPRFSQQRCVGTTRGRHREREKKKSERERERKSPFEANEHCGKTTH